MENDQEHLPIAPPPLGQQFPPPPPPQTPPRLQPVPPPKSSGTGKGIAIGCLISVVLLVAFFGFVSYLGAMAFVPLLQADFTENSIVDSRKPKSPPAVKQTYLSKGNAHVKIAVISVYGIISRTSATNMADSKRIVRELKAAADDSEVIGILLDMDTPGGEVTAADEIHHAIRLIKKESGIPIVTCMHSMGASGGYYIAAATDHIIANRLTFTGSIGVIMGTLNISKLMDKVGVEQETYCSGEMKDMLSMSRPRTEKERAYVDALIQETFEEFARIVSDGRKERYPDAASVKAAEFADGRVLSGARAQELGLVDELGDRDTAVKYICDATQTENPSLVHYSCALSWMDILLSAQSPVRPLGARDYLPVNGVSLKAGQLYFLAPAVVTP
ncbi:MAG: signal peptide peptidase SppA [Victivallales bacterium]|nr:signal peptide peptidase SppA [Victivallales bacterium]